MSILNLFLTLVLLLRLLLCICLTSSSYVMPGTTIVDALDALFSQRQAVLDTLKGSLAAAQDRTKFQADKHRFLQISFTS